MVRKTRRAPVRKSLPTGVLDAVDQVTPALAQKLRASMAKPPFYVNEVLDMVIPEKHYRSLLREAACIATAQVPRNPVFGYQLQINAHYALRVVTTLTLDDANMTFIPDKVVIASPRDNEKVAQLEEYCMNMYQADRALAQVNALAHYLANACSSPAAFRTIWPDFPTLFAGYEQNLLNSHDEPWLVDWGHRFRNMQPGMPPAVADNCIGLIDEARRSIALAQLAEPEPVTDTPGVHIVISRVEGLPPEPVPWITDRTIDDGPRWLRFKL